MGLFVDQVAWERLVRKTRKNPLLRGTPRVGRSFHGMTLRPGWASTRRNARDVLAGAGLLVAVTWIGRTRPESWVLLPQQAVQAILAVLGLLALGRGILSLLAGNQIILDRQREGIIVQWGTMPLEKSARFPLGDMTVQFERASEPKGLGRKVWHEGDVILSLRHARHDGCIYLASDEIDTPLLPAFETLSKYLGTGPEDPALAGTVRTRNGCEVPTEGAGAAAASFRTMAFRAVSSDVAVLAPTLVTRLFLLMFLAAGTAILCLLVNSLWHGKAGWMGLVPGFIGAALAGAALVGLHTYSGCRFTINRSRGVVQIDGRFNRLRRTSLTCPLHEVVAVQICSWYEDRQAAYELNLVLANPHATLLNLMCHANKRAVRQDGQRLAEFLGAPLLDLTKD